MPPNQNPVCTTPIPHTCLILHGNMLCYIVLPFLFPVEHSSGCDISIPPSLDYDTDTLRRELKRNGYIPGPIVPTTKRLYLRKLFRIQKKPDEVSVETKG